VSAERVGITEAGDEGTRDAGHFIAEGEVVFKWADAVGVRDGDVEDTDEKTGPEDNGWCAEGRRS
jgi:hypothetical protein